MSKSSFELRHVGILYRSGRNNRERQGIVIDHLSIPDAGITAIVGASASGKSTLLNLLARFDAPSQELLTSASRLDYISPDGKLHRLLGNCRKLPAGELGFVFQDAYLLKGAPVGLNIGVGMIAAGEQIRSEKIHALLNRVELGEDYDLRRGRHLSGGEAQRVAFCRAFACNPNLILADEPTSSLDPHLARTLIEALQTWSRKERCPVVWVTHNIELASLFADHIIVLSQGRLLPGTQWPQRLPSVPEKGESQKLKALVRRRDCIKTWIDDAKGQPPLDEASVAELLSGSKEDSLPTVKTDGAVRSTDTGKVWARRFVAEIGFVLRLGFSELFSNPHSDRTGPEMVIPAWTVYRGPGDGPGAASILQHLLPAFSRWVLAFVTLLCLLMSYISLESLRVIEDHFARELNRPEVRHVTVGYKRATSSSERDIIFSSPFLKGLEKDLRAAVPDDGNPDQVRVFGRRYEPTARFNPKATDCGSRGGNGFDAMSTVHLEEPLFQSAAARSLEDWRTGAPERSLREILAEVEFDPLQDVIVNEHFLLSRLEAAAGSYAPEAFCLMVHVNKPARIVAVLDRLPGTDRLPYSFLIDERSFRARYSENPPLGNSRLEPFSRAAVYFDATSFRTIWDRLAAARVDIPTDAFKKLEALLRFSITTNRLLLGAIVLILLLAGAAMSLIVIGYIEQNERAFFVMRAFGHPRRSLFLLLIVQMAGVTVLLFVITSGLLFLLDPVVIRPLAEGFGLPSDLLAFTPAKLVVPALSVFGIQTAVSCIFSLTWWLRNRYIASRMQAI